jgi:hypothetical protein
MTSKPASKITIQFQSGLPSVMYEWLSLTLEPHQHIQLMPLDLIIFLYYITTLIECYEFIFGYLDSTDSTTNTNAICNTSLELDYFVRAKGLDTEEYHRLLRDQVHIFNGTGMTDFVRMSTKYLNRKYSICLRPLGDIPELETKVRPKILKIEWCTPEANDELQYLSNTLLMYQSLCEAMKFHYLFSSDTIKYIEKPKSQSSSSGINYQLI